MKVYTGFTLVELLVVIAIIGILSSLTVVTMNDARLKARDAKRRSDMSQLYTALQVYFDKNESYPTCNCSRSDCYTAVLTTSLTNQGGKPYILPIPTDPTNKDPYFYDYCSNDGKEFVLSYQLESEPNVKELRGF